VGAAPFAPTAPGAPPAGAAPMEPFILTIDRKP